MGKPIYEHVTKPEDIRKIARKIRRDMYKVKNRSQLTELVKRAQYLVTLSGGWDSNPSPQWRELVQKYPSIPKVAYREYLACCRLANAIARKKGWKANYGPEVI